MAPKFEGFSKSAPQGKPVTRAMIRREVDDPPAASETENGTAVAAPERERELSAWGGDDIFDLQKLALSIRQNTQEVLDRVGSRFDEVMKAHLAKQEELARQHARLVERLTEYNKRESAFLFAIVGTLILFAVIYVLK